MDREIKILTATYISKIQAQNMKKFTQSLIVILVALISTFIFTAYGNAAPKPKTITHCTLNLQIFVRQGHNVNYNILGQIAFKNANYVSSDWKGNFVKEDGLSFPVYVHFDGPAIYFIIDTVSAEQGRVFGTGIMDSDLDTCTGNGGGTISGPAADDLGNWRGKWTRETTVISEENTPTASIIDTPVVPDTSDIPQTHTYYAPFPWSTLICLAAPFGILLLFIALRFTWLQTPHYTTAKLRKRNVHNLSLQKVYNKTNAEMAGSNKPVVEYLATYTNTDKLFDITFQIEEATQYLGECGVLIAKTLDEKLTKATALEIWAFDGKNAQTTSRILMSHFCNHEEILRTEMQQKGEALLIQPGETITMQTEKLKISAKILEIEYMADTTYPRSVFKKVVMQIDVWKQ